MLAARLGHDCGGPSTESISGQVINQTTETGISGVAVKVFDTAGDPFGSTITGPNGNFSFTGLSSGYS